MQGADIAFLRLRGFVRLRVPGGVVVCCSYHQFRTGD